MPQNENNMVYNNENNHVAVFLSTLECVQLPLSMSVAYVICKIADLGILDSTDSRSYVFSQPMANQWIQNTAKIISHAASSSDVFINGDRFLFGMYVFLSSTP